MRNLLLVAALIAGCVVFGAQGRIQAAGSFPYQYLSPRPDASLVSPFTTIVLRDAALIDSRSLSGRIFRVEGARSGRHSGRVVLADDGRTVIFKPVTPFEPGETVRVAIQPGLATVSGRVLPGFHFEFTTWPDQPADLANPPGLELPRGHDTPSSVARPSSAHAGDAPAGNGGLPDDFPVITLHVPAPSTDEGYVFLSPLSDQHSYLIILDPTSGEPVYYERILPSRKVLDFKLQPNGLLTYYDSAPGVFFGMDSAYSVVRTYRAGNGYRADLHDLQVLPDGHYLLMVLDWHVVDMSKIVPGGHPRAYVIGLIVQEFDTADQVVFEWRSWDHVEITETTTENLTSWRIDYVHGNALELDYDGNILISARNLDQVLKVNRQTGDIIWRLGGKKNEFSMAPGGQFFLRQHDIRRMPNSNVTVYDNRANATPYYSRAVEYKLDEAAKKVEQVWEYRNTPDVYAPWIGNAQRLPSGNTVIGWGIESPAATEVRPDATKVFEFSAVSSNEGSYRVFRFPWVGQPRWPPSLVVEERNGRTFLAVTWNGATEVGSYLVLAGATRNALAPIAVQARTGFQTTYDVTEASATYHYFRVMPLDRAGAETVYSNVVAVPACPDHCSYLPAISVP